MTRHATAPDTVPAVTTDQAASTLVHSGGTAGSMNNSGTYRLTGAGTPSVTGNVTNSGTLDAATDAGAQSLTVGGTFDHSGNITDVGGLSITAGSVILRSGALFDGEQRIDLVKCAFAGAERVSVSRMEVDRMRNEPDRPSYTVDTLHTLREHLPTGVRLRLLIGADQALSLHRWHEPRTIMALAEPLVMRRAGDDESAESLAARIASNWNDGTAGLGPADWHRRVVDVPLVDASSTEARQLLATWDEPGRDGRLRELLGDAVLQRVREIRAGR